MKPAQVASREAFEEAGLIGQIVGKRPLGDFHYQKETDQGDAPLSGTRVLIPR